MIRPSEPDCVSEDRRTLKLLILANVNYLKVFHLTKPVMQEK